MLDRVVSVRGVGDAGKQGCFARRQIFRALGEVVLGCGLDPILRRPELRHIEVAVEDLVFAPLFLKGDGDLGLAEFPNERGFGRCLNRLVIAALESVHEQSVLHVLLGERRSALKALSGNVGDEGAERALRVESVVLVKATVLDRHHSVLKIFVDLVERHHDAVLGVEGREQAAIGRLDA